MKKVYILAQLQYTEGNFGDLESNPTHIHGVYDTKELAEQAASKIDQPIFKAQFGFAKEECVITEMEVIS